MFNFLALLDIRVFGHLRITIVASDWPCTFFTARLFLFSIKTHNSESRGQEMQAVRDEQVSYLHVAPL